MLQETLEKIVEAIRDQKRPEQITAKRYGQYTLDTRELIYNDSAEKYEQLTSNPANKKVRSVKAFSDCIKEELRRRENATGDKETVKINLAGGEFIPDDNFGIFSVNFERLNSQQWNLIKGNINNSMNHRQFLQFIQALKPSIDNFTEVHERLATLRMVGSTTLVSNPIFTKNGQESGYKCTYKLEDGYEGEETFPTGFIVNVPFAKAGDYAYDIPIDLLFYRNDDDELRIQVLCPLFENIEERAIIDEAEYIKSETTLLTDLLILSDF